MSVKLLQLYQSLPVPLRKWSKRALGLIPVSLRMGRRFHRQLEFLERSQWWSRAELEEYQNERLRRLIAHAHENVPYYARLFRELRLRPSDIRTTADLPKLPILKKGTVLRNPADFRAQNIPDSETMLVHTSGTTGRVLPIRTEKKNEFLYGGPFEWRYFRWGGHSPGDPCAFFRAEFLFDDRRNRFFHYDHFHRRDYFSIFGLRAETARAYVKELGRFQPAFFNGYISFLNLLSILMAEQNLAVPVQPRAIFTIGELVLPDQRRRVESCFKTKILDWYGMEERTIVAAQCERAAHHHLLPEFGVAEFVGNAEGGPSDALRLVATGLTNFAMPLIRYDTGDLAAPVAGECPCGRRFPLIKLLGGRRRNFLYDNFRRPIPASYSIVKGIENHIHQFRLTQETPGFAALLIVPGAGFSAADEKLIHENCGMMYGDRLQIEIRRVAEIPPAGRGKMPLVVSTLTEDPAAPGDIP